MKLLTLHRNTFFTCLCWALSLGVSTQSIAQDTVYISDVLYVPMRAGQGTQYRIINAAMKSGTQLTRLEVSEDGEWSRVRTASGTEGWMRNQYLLNGPTAQIQLNTTQARLARLEKELSELKSTNAELSQARDQLTEKADTSLNKQSEMAEELSKIRQLSAGAIELDRRHQELLEKYEMTQTQRDSLLAENENMKGDQRLSFLLYGAGILVFGMLLAIILPALKPKKGYSEWR